MFVSEYVHICVCKCICLLCVCVCVKMKDKHPVKHFHAGHVFVRMFLVWLLGKECVCVCVCVGASVCVDRAGVCTCIPIRAGTLVRKTAFPLLWAIYEHTSRRSTETLCKNAPQASNKASWGLIPHVPVLCWGSEVLLWTPHHQPS